VQDAFGVDICHSVDDLLDDHLDPFLIGLVLLAGDKFFQVLLVVIENDLQGLFLGLVENLQEGYDIGMVLERLEEGDFAEGTGGDALLLVVELDVLDCDGAVVLVDCLVDPPEGALPDLADLPVRLNFFHLNIQTYRASNK
jgi:hypothetical protein